MLPRERSPPRESPRRVVYNGLRGESFDESAVTCTLLQVEIFHVRVRKTFIKSAKLFKGAAANQEVATPDPRARFVHWRDL